MVSCRYKVISAVLYCAIVVVVLAMSSTPTKYAFTLIFLGFYSDHLFSKFLIDGCGMESLRDIIGQQQLGKRDYLRLDRP